MSQEKLLRCKWMSQSILVFATVCALVCQIANAQSSKVETFSLRQEVADLIKQTIESNPQIRSQEASNRSADADIETAKWQFYPTPSLSVERASTQGRDATYANGAQVRYVRLQQPLYTWGRLTAGLSKAQARKIAALAAMDEAKQQMALKVVQAYTEWLTAWLRKQAFLDGYREHQKFEDLIVRRIETGVSPKADLLLVQSRQEQMRGDLLLATSQQDNARVKLSQLLGRAIEDSELQTEFAIDPQLMLARPTKNWLHRAESASPSLVRLNAQVEVAQKEVEEKKSSMMPELYVRAEYQSGSPYITTAPADQTRIFVGFTSNIGAGLSGLSALNSGKAKYEAALEDVDAGRRNLQEQILSELNSLASSSGRYSVLHTAEKFARELVGGGERQFLAGRKSWQELMNTSRELVQAKVQLADVRASLFLSAWRLALQSEELNTVLQPRYFLEITAQ